MDKKELWVQNRASKDVMISDLGIKVCIGKTVNVYTCSPYLTEEQIQKSLESGSLHSRLKLKLLASVSGPPQAISPTKLNRVKESKQPLNVKKIKSSVVIEPHEDDIDNDDSFQFADYGAEENIEMKRVENSVVVSAIQDDPVPTPKQQPLDVKKETSIATKQSHVFVDLMNVASDSIGEIAKDTSPAGASYIVSKKDDPQEESEQPREVPKAKKSECGVVMEDISPEPDSKDDTEATESTFDAKVATKTEDGAIVMKFKERDKTETKAPKAKKKTRKTRSSKKK